MGNSVQHKRRNPANCLGCMGQDNEGFDLNELQIGLDVDKARGRITQQSTAYLTENEKNFFKAASGRNLGLIRFYLSKGININILDEDRTSPLHIACRYGSIQVVEELINNNANLDITDMAGWTPLHVAAFYQRAQVCQLLLKSGADFRTRNRDGNLAQDLVRDKMTSEIFKQSQDQLQHNSERQAKKYDPAQRQYEEYFQLLKLKRQKNNECSSFCEKVSQSKMVSPNSTPKKSKLSEKENLGIQESLSKSNISEQEQKEVIDFNKELGSKINRNLISPCNSIPRFFDDMVSLGQLVLWQNKSRERTTFTDQVKFIKHDYNTENLAIDLFNHSYFMGISYMISTQIIRPTPQSIINWLFNNIEQKNKIQISKLLTNLNLQEQYQILKLFVDRVVINQNLINSLHNLFNKLLIQNDPYLLDILVKEFSRRYYELNFNSKSQSFPFKSEDSLHMFCFALVILDIESTKYDKDNAFKNFFQNIQTINNGDNFNSKFISEIIEQLQSKPIVNLLDQSIDELLSTKLSTYCNPINLIKQKQTHNVNWKLYSIGDAYLLTSDGYLKIFEKSNSQIQKQNNEILITGKQNKQLLYVICKDEQTFIFKQRNMKFKLTNLNDTF
ncbi:unnamed protein product [Paramecium pentaurelia]|uniref:SEC7 domain-containing protein n=1 Tax=Paramecium pentaurelia TaxID=43138 RepID=A0A8S1VM43_9CILI|nr:unnamed protein product [Paramecium pentaurelia]